MGVQGGEDLLGHHRPVIGRPPANDRVDRPQDGESFRAPQGVSHVHEESAFLLERQKPSTSPVAPVQKALLRSRPRSGRHSSEEARPAAGGTAVSRQAS
jgi:hypothetical protein